jgi:TRAP-type C4-dicarboxylate transport system permease small subunit
MRHIAARINYALAACLLAAMAISLLLQIIAREFRLPIDWTEESSRFAFIAMVFLASAYATLKRRHLRVSVFSDLAAKFLGTRVVGIYHLVILIGFDATMVFYSGGNFLEGLQFANISPALGFNQNHLFIFMCIGFTISAFINLSDLALILMGKSDGNLDHRGANPAEGHI